MSKAIYEMVTKRIIEQLESGVIPWHKPWSGTKSGAYNRVTKKSYSLLNQMILQHSGEYATFKQWSDLGGKVRKGEKSEIIVFWKVYPKEQTNADGEKEVINIPILKYINVFHISQIDGIEPLKEEEREQIEPIEKAESLLPQLKQEHSFSYENATYGLKLMAWGFFKKMVCKVGMLQRKR